MMQEQLLTTKLENVCPPLCGAISPADVLYEETALSHTGLRLRPVPSVRMEATGRPVCNADLEAGQMYLGRWRPHLLVLSFRAHKIAVLEVCRPSDVSPERLQAAYLRNSIYTAP